MGYFYIIMLQYLMPEKYTKALAAIQTGRIQIQKKQNKICNNKSILPNKDIMVA